MSSLVFTLATSDIELLQILNLQQQNLRSTQSHEIEADQGFVTVQHNFNILQEMNNEARHIIAKDGEIVIGYALAMTKFFQDKIPELSSMFDLLDNLEVDGLRIGDDKYIVMGQVCIDLKYRGKGIFKGMYEKYFEKYKPLYHWVITEVASRNTRSLRAHFNVGFKEIYRYDEPGIEEWVILRY